MTATVDGAPASFRLSPEGEQFLTSLLGLKDGDDVRPKDLALLDRARLGGARARARRRSPRSRRPAPAARRAEAAPPRRHEPRPTLIRRTRAARSPSRSSTSSSRTAALAPDEIDRFIRRRLSDETLQGFARLIVAGVREHQARIDELISEAAENWRIDRMAAIDRNILRLGAFEMLFDPDVPVKVAINEALELAKRYSTAQSSRFVNGILDRLQNADPNAPASRRAEAEPAMNAARGRRGPARPHDALRRRMLARARSSRPPPTSSSRPWRSPITTRSPRLAVARPEAARLGRRARPGHRADDRARGPRGPRAGLLLPRG